MDWFVLFLKQGSEMVRFVLEKLVLLSAQEELRLDKTGNRTTGLQPKSKLNIMSPYSEARVVELEKIGQIQTSPRR